MSIDQMMLIAQALIGVGAVAIAVVGFYHSRRTQRLEAITLYVGYWRELNRLFLECDRAREAKAKLANKTTSELDDTVMLVAIYINQALVAYHTWRFGGLPRSDLEAEFRGIWHLMAARKTVAKELLDSESYPPKFVAYFKRFV